MKGAKTVRKDLYDDLDCRSLASDKIVEMAGVGPWRSIASKQQNGHDCGEEQCRRP